MHSAEPLPRQFIDQRFSQLLSCLRGVDRHRLCRKPCSLLDLHWAWTTCSSWWLLGQEQRQSITDQPSQLQIRLLPISHAGKLGMRVDIVRRLQDLWTALYAAFCLGMEICTELPSVCLRRGATRRFLKCQDRHEPQA